MLETKAIHQLQRHHPLIVEGMGGYDSREPRTVASAITAQLKRRWSVEPPTKPILLVTQGDPHEEKGIAAITRLIADELSVARGLIFLDPAIADYHLPNADRYKVTLELPYSAMVNTLQRAIPDAVNTIERLVDKELAEKQLKRRTLGKPPLQDYYRDFALLQEVTKIACKQICGGVTVAHTSAEISDFSVSSFYRVGLESGLIDASEMVLFGSAHPESEPGTSSSIP